MIYSVFSDRLGNNLFQFAVALSLSSDVTICVPTRDEYLRTLCYCDTFFKGVPIIDHIPEGIKTYEESSYYHAPIPYIQGENLILKGYFQSYKYFDRDLIKEKYRMDDETLAFIRTNYPQLFTDRFTSIHVRRGDYMNMLFKHPFCGRNYYMEAIDLIGKDEKYIVVSDDIKWCKQHLRLANVIFLEDTSPIIDLYIQSLCTNNIISNSSFSWWGAYLNNSGDRVVAPSMWFGFRTSQDTRDLLLKNYTIIDNHYSFFDYFKAWTQYISNYLRYKLDYVGKS